MISISRPNSVPFVKKLMKSFSIFGIVPWYNFDEGRAIHKNIFKGYASILSLLLTCLSLVCLRVRYHIIYHDVISVQEILEMLNGLVALFTVLVFVLGAAFWNLDPWKDLLIQCVSTPMDSRSVNHVFMVKYAKVILFAGNVYYISFWFISLFVLKREYRIVPYYFVSFLLDYYSFIISFAIATVAGLIQFKYRCITKSLRDCSVENVRLDRAVQKMIKLYLKTEKVVQIFNKLFGFPLMLLCSSLVIKILNGSVHVTNHEGYFRHTELIAIYTLTVLKPGVSMLLIRY